MGRRRTPHHLVQRNALESITVLDGIGPDCEPLRPRPNLNELPDPWPAPIRDGCWVSSMQTIRVHGQVKTLAAALYEEVFAFGKLDGFRLKRTPSCHPKCVNPAHQAAVAYVSRPRRPPRRVLPPVKLVDFDMRWDDERPVTVGQLVKYMLAEDRFAWPDRCMIANGSPDTTDKKSLRRGFFRLTSAEPLRAGTRLLSSCGNYDCVNPRHARPVFGRRSDAKALVHLQAEKPTQDLNLDQLIDKAAREQGLAMPRDELEMMAQANGKSLKDFLEVDILGLRKPPPKPKRDPRTVSEWLDELEDIPISQLSPAQLVRILALEWPDHPPFDDATYVDLLPALADNLPNLREALTKSALWRDELQ